MDIQPMQAMVRFGLGARPGEPPPSDPRGWLAGQIRAPDPTMLDPAPTTANGLSILRSDRDAKVTAAERRTRPLFRAEAAALLENALTTPAPFRERLVWFWANHFTVSVRRPACAAVTGAFVAEAIRPHVTGRFADMLLAVMRHPAMLLYLDNVASVGPDSPAGQRGRRGLNENLARECLELHTVSPAAGYTQADVTSFARILTGWSIDLKDDPPGFVFRVGAHEPGDKALLGQSFPPGQQGGEMALAFLAAHPATHRHLAEKLVRHFVADDPAPDEVRAVEAVLRDTGGDLGAASLALIDLPRAWQPGGKLRTPQEFVLAALRGLDLPADRRPALLGAVGGLGQPVFAAPAPNGWPDRAADWAAPEAMIRRIDWTYALAGRAAGVDPMQAAEAALGPLLRAETLDAVRHAGSRREALTLLFASPEFQRR
ncbi:MAG: DUF1800 domain-containing protein [Proteobacteria bacterium]|nr:DUF1800 domain-containing protein [Pseudomonadota bacterium]